MKRSDRFSRDLQLVVLILLLEIAVVIVAMRIHEISTDPSALELYGASVAVEPTPKAQTMAPRTAAEDSHSFSFLKMEKEDDESIETATLLACSISIPLSEVRIEPEPPEICEDDMIQQDEPAAPQVWREDVPLRPELQQVLLDACTEAGIDPLLMLGLIETESGFNEYIVSQSGDYGLCQLNHNYFDPSMTPEENLRAGVELLGRHLKTYGDIKAALTAYHWGHDNGTRSYASVVIGKAAAWGYGCNE